MRKLIILITLLAFSAMLVGCFGSKRITTPDEYMKMAEKTADQLVVGGIPQTPSASITGGTITGVTIDSSAIGGTTPAAGDFVILTGERKRYYPATLSDTSTPHQLLVAECRDTLITTQGWNGTADITFNLPDISAYDGTEGVLNVKFLDSKGMQDADTDMYIDPDASTQIVLDGTITGTDGDRIWWDDIVIYSGAVCHSDYDATLGGYWVCDSINGLAADKGS